MTTDMVTVNTDGRLVIDTAIGINGDAAGRAEQMSPRSASGSGRNWACSGSQ